MEKKYDQISNDLALEILAKLPVKSLKRFSCVQKSWLNLLENSNFKSMYYENLKSKTAYSSSLLLWRNFYDQRGDGNNVYKKDVYLLSGEKYENIVRLVLPSLVEEYDVPGMVIECVNGIICYSETYGRKGKKLKIGLWNPKTDERKIIPPSIIIDEPGFDLEVSVHGFGYDNMNDDYKVIQCVYYIDYEFYLDGPSPIWQIYSLKNNCWKKLELEMNHNEFLEQGSVKYLNGVCHWCCEEYGEEVIVSFNLSTETFQTTSIVLVQRNDAPPIRVLVVLNESLALISSLAENSCIEISILGEIGVKESWVKLFTVRHFLEIDFPFGMGNKCDVIYFIENYNDELASFDVITGKIIHNIGIKAEWFGAWIYKENLLSFTTRIN
ncbi:F-box/kelch-repeat protein At3g06240-like [Arachis ipaensis]|uniref:Uncharacterized protein n=1 Tax=Arachis hypogaea TaxID=3818 RepID=A0A444YYG1_ARAHY|nr:F-box/kelch-repeat protein At3g06240-like [Arachis ipaensis]XP_025653384.1 F-box/kelch-repeat protein At3g06240-like [Arachis hypogaea]RYR06965.1 hypothetical protein Ahy_B05g074285 [Arachis hypogaea]